MNKFDEGFQLGARVEHRVAVEAAANALLAILGKDAGDGVISLGAAGDWLQRNGRWLPLKGSAASTWDGETNDGFAAVQGAAAYVEPRR